MTHDSDTPRHTPSTPLGADLPDPPDHGNLPPLVLPDPVLTMHRRHVPILVAVIFVSVACIGTTGLYTGSQIVQRREEARALVVKLDFQKQLADKDAAHAAEMARTDLSIATLTTAVHDLDAKISSRTKVGDDTLATAKAALRTSRSNAVKTDQLATDQVQIKQQIVDAAVTAHAVEKKVDSVASATVPAPPTHWWNPGSGH